MDANSNSLEAKVDYLEKRQVEDRDALRTISENGTATATALAVVAESVHQSNKQRTEDQALHVREHEALWRAIGTGREFAVRLGLVLLAGGGAWVVAGGRHP